MIRLDEIRDIMMRVIETGNSIYFQTDNSKQQESCRVLSYRARNQLGNVANEIAICKEVLDDKLFIKIFLREPLQVFEKSPDGKLIEVLVKDQDNDRIIVKMREDGFSDEEIEEYIKRLEEKDEG